MKNLPNVTPINIDKDIRNYQEKYYMDREYKKKDVNINKKINEIFSSSNYVYKSKVRIELKDRVLIKDIIGKTKDELLTLDGMKIKIVDIISIDKV